MRNASPEPNPSVSRKGNYGELLPKFEIMKHHTLERLRFFDVQKNTPEGKASTWHQHNGTIKTKAHKPSYAKSRPPRVI